MAYIVDNQLSQFGQTSYIFLHKLPLWRIVMHGEDQAQCAHLSFGQRIPTRVAGKQFIPRQLAVIEAKPPLYNFDELSGQTASKIFTQCSPAWVAPVAVHRNHGSQIQAAEVERIGKYVVGFVLHRMYL